MIKFILKLYNIRLQAKKAAARQKKQNELFQNILKLKSSF